MNILVIPGLHPSGFESVQRCAYEAAAETWRHEGHTVRVQQFGWYTGQTLDERRAALQEAIDAMPPELYVIGASAGGLAAIGALRDNPHKIQKVVTVASPLQVPEAAFETFRDRPFVPPLLEQAYKYSDEYLRERRELAAAQIAGLYGRQDKRVPPAWSRSDFIASEELPTYFHGMTILAALTKRRRLTQALLFGSQGYYD